MLERIAGHDLLSAACLITTIYIICITGFRFGLSKIIFVWCLPQNYENMSHGFNCSLVPQAQ